MGTKLVYKLPIINKGGIVSIDNTIIELESYKKVIDEIGKFLKNLGSHPGPTVTTSYHNTTFMDSKQSEPKNDKDSRMSQSMIAFKQMSPVFANIVGTLQSIDYNYAYIVPNESMIPWFESLKESQKHKRGLVGLYLKYLVEDQCYTFSYQPTRKTVYGIDTTEIQIINLSSDIMENCNRIFGTNFPDCLNKEIK